MNALIQWLKHVYNDPELSILIIWLLGFFALLIFAGQMLAPILVSVAFAYLLQWFVVEMKRAGLSHRPSVSSVYTVFLGLFLLAVLGLVPILWNQGLTFVNEWPQMVIKTQKLLLQLPEQYPDYVSASQVQHVIAEMKLTVSKLGQAMLSASISTLTGIITLAVYVVLVPLLVFFFLMDRELLLSWLKNFLPKNRRLLVQVSSEVNVQIGNYIRGKLIECIIVAIVCYIAFGLFKLHYAALLSVLVGVSVIIPYIGAVIVTIPVVVIALIQWGLTAKFIYLVFVYAVIITLDANVLIPLLFSEAVALHPVAIIVAIVVFGGWWGFWGVFFAIPLATLVKAVLNCWPKIQDSEQATAS